MNASTLPLYPLVLANVPATLVQVLEQEGISHVWQTDVPRGGRLVVSGDAPHKQVARAGQTVINLAAWPDDARRALVDLADHSSVPQAWVLGRLAPREEVASHDRRRLRELVAAALRASIEGAGGIWLKLSAFPAGYQTVFNFRFDHDAYFRQHTLATLAAIRGHEGATSHYVCASTHAIAADFWPLLSGLDVGSHGYRHHTYADFAQNRRNLERGIATLRAHGVEPQGFVAPHGRWRPELQQALEVLGITHSSEFSLAYDDLPWFTSPHTLQLPIHPVCLGIMLDAASRCGASRQEAVEATAEHFVAHATAQAAAREPILLYGHPDGRLGRHPEVLHTLLRSIESTRGVWEVSLSTLAAWWRARRQVCWSATPLSEGAWSITVGQRPRDWNLAWELWRGNQRAEIADPATSTFHLDHLRWEPATPRISFAPRHRVRQGWKASLRRALDWERVTPVHELSAAGWRGSMKRWLRTVKP